MIVRKSCRRFPLATMYGSFSFVDRPNEFLVRRSTAFLRPESDSVASDAPDTSFPCQHSASRWICLLFQIALLVKGGQPGSAPLSLGRLSRAVVAACELAEWGRPCRLELKDAAPTRQSPSQGSWLVSALATRRSLQRRPRRELGK